MEKIHWLQKMRRGFLIASIALLGIALNLVLNGSIWAVWSLGAAAACFVIEHGLFYIYKTSNPIYENICDAIRVGHTGRMQIYHDSRLGDYTHDEIDFALLHMVERNWLHKRVGENDFEAYFSFTNRYKNYFPYERIQSNET